MQVVRALVLGVIVAEVVGRENRVSDDYTGYSGPFQLFVTAVLVFQA